MEDDISQCLFCNKGENEVELNDMETNSIKYGEDIIEYEDLLQDVLNLQMNSGLICIDCQNQILTFHCFKTNINHNFNHESVIQRKEIKRKLEMFLDDFESSEKVSESLVVLRYNQCFAVVPDSKRELMQNFQSWQPRVHLNRIERGIKEPEEKKVQLLEPEAELKMNPEYLDFIVSEVDENVYDEIIVEGDQCYSNEALKVEFEFEAMEATEEELIENNDDSSMLSMPQKHKPSKEQREWANETVKSSYRLEKSEDGVAPVWDCTICQSKFNSAQAIRLHLLAKHISEEEEAVEFLSDDIKDWLKKESRERRVLIETLDGNKLQWTCGICNFSCLSNKTFRTHLIETHIQKTKPVRADASSKTMSYHQKQWIQSHIKHEEEENTWTCLKCNQNFNAEKTLRKHLLEHASQLTSEDFKEIGPNQTSRLKKVGKTESRWTCKECWFQFSAQRSYDSHMKLHETLKAMNQFTEVHQCEECNMFFRSIEDLSVHVDGHSEGASVLVPAEGIALQKTILFKRLPLPTDAQGGSSSCGHCGRKVDDDVNCRSHLLLHHVNPLICPKDGRQFKAMQPYISHLQKVHSELFPTSLLCTHCKVSFDNIYDRLAHMKQCEEKKFTCDHCDKKYSNKNYLSSHLKREMGLTICTCQVCGKNFKAKDELKIHMRSHTKEKPYKCSQCEKRYTTTSARASHMETHKDTVIQCEVCSVMFVARRHYIVHYKRYHDEAYRQKQFREQTCPHCSKQFLRRDRLREHIERVHRTANT